jgi:hypothetical protein
MDNLIVRVLAYIRGVVGRFILLRRLCRSLLMSNPERRLGEKGSCAARHDNNMCH